MLTIVCRLVERVEREAQMTPIASWKRLNTVPWSHVDWGGSYAEINHYAFSLLIWRDRHEGPPIWSIIQWLEMELRIHFTVYQMELNDRIHTTGTYRSWEKNSLSRRWMAGLGVVAKSTSNKDLEVFFVNCAGLVSTTYSKAL
jgi:hypothetical protein